MDPRLSSSSMPYGSMGLSLNSSIALVDPGILTQSFPKSGYGAARGAKDNSPCSLSAWSREKKIFPYSIPNTFLCIFHMPKLGI